MDRDAFDIQTLRLLKAFLRVQDQKARSLILKVAEAAADGASLNATTIEQSNLEEPTLQ